MKIVTFGEIMARITPEGFRRFAQTDKFEITYGGAEANTGISLAGFGEQVTCVTKFPDNDLGKAAERTLMAHGVDVSRIAHGGERLGVYFCERGASARASKVIYDRKNSAIATASVRDFDWDGIFADADWFHWTGITPALSDGCAAILADACRAAAAHGVTVSCDVNYRATLWSEEKAGRVMRELMPYVDVVIVNEEHCRILFGITPDDPTLCGTPAGYAQIAQKTGEAFSVPTVVITVRTGRDATENSVSALLWQKEPAVTVMSRTFDVHIVERIGGGDALSAGLIYALRRPEEFAPQEAVDFAVAAEVLKHTVEGDFNEVTVDEVLALARGSASGRVRR